MLDVTPQENQIKNFINTITRGWVLVGEPLIELRCISTVGSINVARFKIDKVDMAVDHAQQMNIAKQNIYMCINPINPDANIAAGKAAKDEDILSAFYCFADADTKGAMENIMTFAGPKFTMCE